MFVEPPPSVLSRLNPTVKLVTVMAAVLSLTFTVRWPTLLALAVAAAAATIALGNVPLRRLRVRGLLHDGSHRVIESEFCSLLAELGSASQKPPHDRPTPAREIIGHAGLDWQTGEVDLHKHEKALVRITATAPGAARTLRLMQLFEGRDPQEEFTGTAENL